MPCAWLVDPCDGSKRNRVWARRRWPAPGGSRQGRGLVCMVCCKSCIMMVSCLNANVLCRKVNLSQFGRIENPGIVWYSRIDAHSGRETVLVIVGERVFVFVFSFLCFFSFAERLVRSLAVMFQRPCWHVKWRPEVHQAQHSRYLHRGILETPCRYPPAKVCPARRPTV